MRKIILLFIAFFLLLTSWENVNAQAVNPYGSHTIPAVTMNEDGTFPTNQIDFSTPLGRTSTGVAWTITVTTTKAAIDENSGATIIMPLFTHINTGEVSTALTFYQFIDRGINISKGGLYSTTATSIELDGTGDLPVGTPIEIKLILAGEYIFRIVTAGGLSSFNSSLLSMVYDEVWGISAGYPADVKVEIKNTAETVLNVATKSLSFSTPPQTTSAVNYVNIEAAEANITYVLTGTDPEAFKLNAAAYPPWSASTGGRLEVRYEPPTLGTHSAQLEISTPGLARQTVNLNGTCVFPDVAISPDITNSASDAWYYIYNPWRARQDGGYLFTDDGAQLVQDVLYSTTEEGKQLWKLVEQGAGKYVFINQATGRAIDCTTATDNAAEYPVLTSSMPTTDVNDAPSTFCFYQGTAWNTGYWIINNWEKGASINKSNANNLYSVWGSPESGDLGNSVAFFKASDRELLIKEWDDRSKPKLSTNDTEYWYRMQFRNAAITQSVVDKGKNNRVGQAAIANAEDSTLQYWKFTGTSLDNCKIESFAGYEIASNGSDRYISVNKGEGNAFKLEANTNPANAEYVFWQFNNITTTCNGQYYISNAGNTEVTGQAANNAGNWIYFSPVTTDPTLRIESDALNFDLAPVNRSKTLPFGVLARSLTGSDVVAYELEGADKEVFAVTAGADWSAKQGGTLNIAFTPTATRAYSATLKLTAAGEVKTVDLTGTGTTDPFLEVSPLELAFGTTAVGMPSEAKTLTASIVYASGDISYTKKNGEAAFDIDASAWTPATGGTLRITFKPTEEKEYTETLEISSPGAESKEVLLTGTGEMLDLPVSLSTTDNEVWYYMQFDKLTGNNIQDFGENKMLETRPPLPGVEGQLWKFVATDVSGKYQIISKLGNQIAFTAAATGEVVANRFYTTATTAYTYNFVKREDEGWQIYCNDENSFVNKLSPGDLLQDMQIGKLIDNPHNGSSIAFIPADDMKFRLPIFSTETDVMWYLLKFRGLMDLPDYAILAIQDEGIGRLSLGINYEGATDQYWKLVGTWDDFKIIGFNNTEFLFDGDRFYEGTGQGMGSTFKLVWDISSSDDWRIYDKTAERLVGHSEAAFVRGYTTASPAVMPVVFVRADGLSSIQPPAIDPNDPLLATKYYNLYGIEVRQPGSTGIYIVKNIYASGKTQTVKKLVVIR